MNKHILILGLETLLEQLVDSRDYSDDNRAKIGYVMDEMNRLKSPATDEDKARWLSYTLDMEAEDFQTHPTCLLYTSPSPRDS